MYLKTNALFLIAPTVLAVSMAAQSVPDSAPGQVIVLAPNQSVPDSGLGQVTAGPVLSPGPELSPKGGMIMGFERMETAPVKGTPFCATVTTEHTQSFPDGNRIHTSDNSTLCRDSEGRTRREASLNLLGAGPQDSTPKLITIVDPVAGVRYMLDPDNKVAHKMTLPAPGNPSAALPALPAKGEGNVIYQSSGGSERHALSRNMFFSRRGQDSNEPAPTTQNLGDRTINGIHASGMRITTTIPSGNMGNDKPISVISEQWYSSDLKTTVMTKHSDPWAGELKTEFTTVNTSEPEPSLFMVPSDYRIVDDKTGPFRIQFSAPGPPAR